MRKPYQKPSFEIRNAEIGPHGPILKAHLEEPLVQLRQGRGNVLYSGMHWHPAERFTEVPAEELIRRTRGRRLRAVGTLAALTAAVAIPVFALTAQIRLRMIENTPFRLGPPSFETYEPYGGVEPTTALVNPRLEKMMKESLVRRGAAKGYALQIEPPVPSLHKMDWELRQKLATMLAVEVGFAEPTPEVYSRVLNSVKVRAQERFDKGDAKRKEQGLAPLTAEEKLSIYHTVLDPSEYQGLRERNIRLVRDEDPETSRRWHAKLAEAGKFVDENWEKPIDPHKDGRFFYTSDVETDENGNPMFDEKGRPVLRRPRLPSDWDAKHVSTTVWSDKSAKAHKAIIVAKPATPTPVKKPAAPAENAAE